MTSEDRYRKVAGAVVYAKQRMASAEHLLATAQLLHDGGAMDERQQEAFDFIVSRIDALLQDMVDVCSH